eukprot:920817-Alexandrium_andersonii.AAC.1
MYSSTESFLRLSGNRGCVTGRHQSTWSLDSRPRREVARSPRTRNSRTSEGLRHRLANVTAV